MLSSAEGALKEIKGFKIEQGPACIRFLSFCAGLASAGCVVFLVINPKNAIFHPVMYILYAYIGLFALTTMLFEAKAEWIEKVSFLDGYQNMLIKRCEFLTLMGGRGLFYCFQATLWLSFANSLEEIIEIAAACGLGVVGVLHFFAHFGIMPHEIKEKAIAAGKQALATVEERTGVDVNRDGKVGSA